jgi:O-antigen/teichoic acid export membrane protein
MAETPNEEHKTIVKGTIWGLIGSSATKLILFIYWIIVARVLSQDDIGTFSVALSIATIATVFSDLGFSNAFGRYVPYFLGKKENDKVYWLLGSGYLIGGTVSLIFAAVLFFSSAFISAVFKNPLLEKPLQFFAFYIVINTFFTLNNMFLQGKKMIKESNIITAIQNVLKLVITLILFLAFERSAFSLAIAFVCSSFIAALLSFWYVRNDLALIKFELGSKKTPEKLVLLKDVVLFGLTLSIIITLYALIGNTDIILLGYFLPENDVGVYKIVVTLVSILTLFPSAIGSIFFPVISELHGKGKKEEMLKVSKTAVRWLLFLIMPLTLVFLVFPDNALAALFGTAYSRGTIILVIFTFALFIRSLVFVHGYLLAAVRLISIEFRIALVAALANVVLDWFLIPLYGLEGAAIASTTSLLLIAALLVYYTKKIFGFTFPSDFYKPLIAGLFALAFIFLVKDYVLMLINNISEFSLFGDETVNLIFNKLIKLVVLGALFVFSCIVYTIALIFMKAFANEDIAIISAALRKAKLPNEFIMLTEMIVSSE